MMRRRAAVAAGLLLVGLAGCSDTPPPVNEAKPFEQPKAEELTLTPPTKPDKSGEDGARLLAEVLAAHTGGKPDRLNALRECSFTRKGQAETPNGRASTEWKTQLRWPDRYKMQIELGFGGGVKQVRTYGSNPTGTWLQIGDATTAKVALDPDQSLTLKSQLQEDSVFLLFILADSNTIVLQGTDAKVGDDTLHILHAWTPGLEYARLSIDAKTKLLTRFTYTGREGTLPAVKEVVFAEHKEFTGVKLGSRVYVKAGGKLMAEWTELTVDTTKPDPKVFDGP